MKTWEPNISIRVEFNIKSRLEEGSDNRSRDKKQREISLSFYKQFKSHSTAISKRRNSYVFIVNFVESSN